MPDATDAGSCLLRSCAAVAAAAQWHSMRNFQHAAPGCGPANLKKCLGRPDSGGKGLAGLGGMGGLGVAIESGCCRSLSTGRV